MNNEHGYKFFLQECDKKGNVLVGTTPKSIEEDFNIEDGSGFVRYKECKGLNTTGSANIYTEQYADSDRLRVHVPENLTHKQTTVTLTLYFVGENRYKCYDAFNAYLKASPYHIYYDTARHKKLVFFVKDEISTNTSQWYGTYPYIEVQYKLANIYGQTFDVEQQ